MKIKKITAVEVEQLQSSNAQKYTQEIKKNSQKISQNQSLKSLAATFLAAKKTFQVKDYDFQEQLTGLTSSKFFNTRSYLALLTSPEIAVLFQEQELVKLNQHFLFVFKNGQATLLNAKNNLVGDQALIEADYLTFLNQYYADYLELIGLRLTVFLTKLISIYQALFHHDEEPDFLMDLLDDLTFEFFNDLSFKATKILGVYLKKLYQKYPMNVEKMRQKNAFNKKAFADFAFAEEDTFFQTLVTSEDEALAVLGLTAPTTWKAIKTSYRELAKRYHPDLHQSDETTTRQMESITNAYNYLKKQKG